MMILKKKIFAPFCHKYTAIDMNPRIIEIAQARTPKLINNLTFKAATLKSIIDSSEKFDIIYMKNTFHLMNNKTAAMIAIRELMTCPSDESNQWADPKLNKDNKDYDKEEWKKMKTMIDESNLFLDKIENMNTFKDNHNYYYFI